MLRTLGIVAPLACAIALSATSCSRRHPPEAFLPDGTQVTAPEADVPVALAAFSGTWHGYWGGELDSMLVIERVSANGEATGVYAWGADPTGEFGQGNMAFRGTIANGVLTFGRDVRFDFTMKADGTLAGQRSVDGDPDDDVVMTRVR